MNRPDNTQSAKARNSAILCLMLAVLTMATTAWFVVEGVIATEPDSPARWAKVASGVLLLALEAAAFWLAGQWHEHKGVLRALGFGILALEITLMSLSQISIGLTAGKAASNGAGTIEEIRAQAKESRAAAEALRADAASLRGSKHGWLKQQAGERSAAAAEQSKSAAAAVAALEKHAVAKVSTPIVEIVGQNGLIGLSIALSVALSLSGIVLMHVAGSLWRRASGALPVDVQILELLHRVHGVPTAAPIHMAMQPPAGQAPALASPSFKQAGAVAPAGAPVGLSYTGKAMFGAGALAAMAAPVAHSAPAVPAIPAAGAPATVPADVLTQGHHAGDAGVPAQVHHVEDAGVPAQEHPASDSGVLTQGHLDGDAGVPAQVQAKQRKRTAVPDGSKIDTGTSGKSAARYRRVKAGVLAGTIAPSVRGIQRKEGGGTEVVTRYLQALEKEGVIVRAGRGFVLAGKGGAA